MKLGFMLLLYTNGVFQMSIWERYSSEQRKKYVDFVRMYGSLSAMFNQKASETGAPYLDSKFQETIYARSFNSENVDIGNTPHDILSVIDEDRIGIGIKTWLNSNPSFQKVMQLKRYRNELDPFIQNQKADDLTNKLSEIKNDRLITDYGRLGLSDDQNIYHYVTRDEGQMEIQETAYPLIDMAKVHPVKMTSTSLTFTDGIKDYKYTFGDSQIWMRFGENDDSTLLEKIPVEIMDDPFEFLRNAFASTEFKHASREPIRDDIFLPLYSYQRQDVMQASGINASFGKPKNKNSDTPRPEAEAYIPIPSVFKEKYPYWFDDNVDITNYKAFKQNTGQSSISLKLHLPDGKIYDALVGQEGFKALETAPQSALGKWLLYDVLKLKPRQHVTMDILEQKGFDSVRLWHKDPNNKTDVWIDFAPLGSFESFIKKDPIDLSQIDDE